MDLFRVLNRAFAQRMLGRSRWRTTNLLQQIAAIGFCSSRSARPGFQTGIPRFQDAKHKYINTVHLLSSVHISSIQVKSLISYISSCMFMSWWFFFTLDSMECPQLKSWSQQASPTTELGMQVGWDVGWSDRSYQMPGDAVMPVFRLSSAQVQTKTMELFYVTRWKTRKSRERRS